MNMSGMANMPLQRNQFSSYFNPTQVASASTNNIVWVQGIEGAKAWQLNPNSMVILLDSELEGKMYIKVSDNIGMSTLRVFNYVEELSSTNNVTNSKDLDLSIFVTKEELNSLVREVIESERVIPAVVSDDTTTKSQPKVIIKK